MKTITVLASLPVVLLSFSQLVAAASSSFSPSAQEPLAQSPEENLRHGHDNQHRQKPNFLVFLTDDQDLHMNSLDYQPLVQKYLRNQGTDSRWRK